MYVDILDDTNGVMSTLETNYDDNIKVLYINRDSLLNNLDTKSYDLIKDIINVELSVIDNIDSNHATLLSTYES